MGLIPISFIVGTESDNFESVVRALLTIGTENDSIITFFPADRAVQKNDQEISTNRATVIAPEISFKWFTQRERIGYDHVNFFADGILDRIMFFE